MLEFILLLVIACFWIWGIHFIFQDEQIFGNVGIYVRTYWPRWVYKPLIGCMPCQSSIHGMIIFFIYPGLNHWYLMPIFIICLTGLNAILKSLIYAD